MRVCMHTHMRGVGCYPRKGFGRCGYKVPYLSFTHPALSPFARLPFVPAFSRRHVVSLRNNMFELADRLVGIYKTQNATKSVTINPHELGKAASRAGQQQQQQQQKGAEPALGDVTNAAAAAMETA